MLETDAEIGGEERPRAYRMVIDVYGRAVPVDGLPEEELTRLFGQVGLGVTIRYEEVVEDAPDEAALASPDTPINEAEAELHEKLGRGIEEELRLLVGDNATAQAYVTTMMKKLRSHDIDKVRDLLIAGRLHVLDIGGIGKKGRGWLEAILQERLGPGFVWPDTTDAKGAARWCSNLQQVKDFGLGYVYGGGGRTVQDLLPPKMGVPYAREYAEIFWAERWRLMQDQSAEPA